MKDDWKTYYIHEYTCKKCKSIYGSDFPPGNGLCPKCARQGMRKKK